ncbi:MAG TPA: hypothetical protein VIY28_13250 [Pseudonocardiaceae bacterium]
MTMVVEDRAEARVDGLLEVLREAEADFRRSYARVLQVVAELEEEKAGAVSGFCGSRWRTRAARRMTRRGGCAMRWRIGRETAARIPAHDARTGTPRTREL